jgi:hypothetical protein
MARKKKRSAICGTKTMTAPTPAKMPSVTKSLSGPSDIREEASPPSHVMADDKPSIIGAASQKMETKRIAMITAKMASPQILWIRMRSTLSVAVSCFADSYARTSRFVATLPMAASSSSVAIDPPAMDSIQR